MNGPESILGDLAMRLSTSIIADHIIPYTPIYMLTNVPCSGLLFI